MADNRTVYAMNTPDKSLGDPNAIITDPTGGARNFNILDVFKSFGYYPSQEEISALAPTFQGRYNIGETGTSAVSQYVLQKRAEAERQKNDPLAALQKHMEESVALMKNQVTGLYGQLQDTLGSAPQLFGNLTPDQIQTYLAPLQDSFKKQLSLVQGTIASRGIPGSSTENNALAETNRQFMDQTMATGLQVGMDSQKSKAAAIQNQINNLFGLTGTEEGIAGGAAGQKSQQDLGQSNLIASLPYFLSQDAFAKNQYYNAQNKGMGAWDVAERVIGDTAQIASSVAQFIPFAHPAQAPQRPATQAPGSNPYPNFQSPYAYPSGANSNNYSPEVPLFQSGGK